jgi:hypothetical protein
MNLSRQACITTLHPLFVFSTLVYDFAAAEQLAFSLVLREDENEETQ